MPTPIPENRSPWLPPKEPSVFDSYRDRILRTLGSIVGADDPAGTMMGMVGPLTAAQAPAKSALSALGGTAKAYRDKVIRAFHGSPHDFETFDLSKIGTGEGAQAYGHGLYFAENPATAKAYRDQVSAQAHRQRPFEFEQVRGLAKSGVPVEEARASVLRNLEDQLDEARFNLRSAQAVGPRQTKNTINPVTVGGPERELVDALQRKIAELKAYPADALVSDPGKMYEVNIHADPEQFLDWDAPLSQQPPNVQQVIQRTMADVQPVKLRDGSYSVTRVGKDGSGLVVREISESTPEAAREAYGKFVLQGQGSDVYRELAKAKATSGAFPEILVPRAEQATAALREAGIPGIKYLDQGSRTAGEGTRNYVVFDDKLISIVKKYVAAGMAVNEAIDRARAERGQ